MDLDDATAQQVLNSGIKSGGAIYSYYNTKAYEFRADNAGGYHGYIVNGNKVPNAVLRRWLAEDLINHSTYKKMTKDGPKK